MLKEEKNMANLEKKVDENKCVECSNPIIVGKDGSKICSTCGLVAEEIIFAEGEGNLVRAFTSDEQNRRRTNGPMSKLFNLNLKRDIDGRVVDKRSHSERVIASTRGYIKALDPDVPKAVLETSLVLFENILQKKRLLQGRAYQSGAKACYSVVCKLLKRVERIDIDLSNNILPETRYKDKLVQLIVQDEYFKEYTKKRGLSYYSKDELSRKGDSFIEKILNEKPKIKDYIPYKEFNDRIETIIGYLEEKKIGQGRKGYGIAAAAAYIVERYYKKKLLTPFNDKIKSLEERLGGNKTEDIKLKIQKVKSERYKVRSSIVLGQELLAYLADVTRVTLREDYKVIISKIGKEKLKKMLYYGSEWEANHNEN